MVRQYSSTAVETFLTVAVNASIGTLVVDSVTGFPLTFPYTLSIDAGNVSKEIVSVTAAAGTTLTVTRAEDSTTGVSHSIGAVVSHDHSARDFRESREHEASTTAHGATGANVGTTNTQTLTNKDMSSGTNTFPATLATAASVTAHVDDPTDAHDASAISFTPAAGVAATDTQAAVVEVAGDVTTHTAATVAHGATGAVVGTTNVQTLTNKSLTSPTITGSGTATLASATVTNPVTAPTYFATGEGAPVMAINTGVISGVSFTSVDTGVGFTESSGVFTALNAGLYLVEGHIDWPADSTGLRRALIYVNGSMVWDDVRGAISGSTNGHAIAHVVELAANDTVGVRFQQTSGGGLAVDDAAIRITRLSSAAV